MDLSALTKEQKQYIVIGIIFSFIVIVVLYNILGAMEGSTTTKQGDSADSPDVLFSLGALEQQMKVAERSAQRELSLQKKYHDQVQRLQRIQSSKLPDIHDQYSWGTDLIYTRARELGIDVKSTHETYRSTSEDSLYKLYALTIMLVS